MMPGINPKQMKAAMKKMGMKMEEIEDVQKVVVYTSSGNYVFEPAEVVGITMQGQTSYQLSGTPRFEPAKVEIPESDVELVASQTSVSPETARAALEECNGDIAEAILKLTAVE
ncbi:MAG TPA: nascent polypeptide-associated complex protein [Methanocorpusculum sp.]|nr:nascent polypeptide-associated complex protein [Candidatus Methanocorpusculum faecipullorum]HJK54918.1 nascent polypeptide-associated complex protein [Methanocorpusculum sp.]HJK57708.1 nascent polypeptide-associated complex protein [Methanocorpusculum sp.]HJK59639.1 nascent polypeptide-associated complex protein [Methanocorpusculum sp.]HJK70441.1 nascent polypeptide-associated complex protein [Methanocorpusculum sp.]